MCDLIRRRRTLPAISGRSARISGGKASHISRLAQRFHAPPRFSPSGV